MVSYGAAIWAFPMQGRKIRHLSALQRPFLLSITRAFRTTFTDALNILAGVLPLHLRIEEQAVTQQVQQLRLSLTYDYVTFSQEHFENKTSQLHIYPAIKGIGIHLTKNPAYVAPSGYISIYTDGSRIDEKVGSAFVVLSEQQPPLHQWQMQLSTENSVFQSEALAIHEAIRYLTNNKISKALIHTDSLSSMQAIANSEHTSPQIAGIQKRLRENAHNHYVIKWIKAHTGIYGNELADGLAKDAATGNNITTVQIPWPTSYLKKTLRQIVCNKWQQEWTNSLTGRRTFYFKPKVDLQRLIASPLLVRYIFPVIAPCHSTIIDTLSPALTNASVVKRAQQTITSLHVPLQRATILPFL
ncbi:uncharacterized protein LOC118191941 [Stegodyphus dumicola]|uniref:uncharacterized protein LOC118191941 n=1 Tax=Stegodyphus dumicola TaxID=202533 RepID=UPI0015A8F040|nr:uncharacterized protein LOC118191941 [Stegodyphus dumicola]